MWFKACTTKYATYGHYVYITYGNLMWFKACTTKCATVAMFV